MLDDLFSTTKGPGLVGLLLGVVVLIGFAGLAASVFDGRFNGDDANSLQTKLKEQAAEIEFLEATARDLDDQIDQVGDLRSVRSEVDVLTSRLALVGKSAAELTTSVEGLNSTIAAIEEEHRAYRQDYRDVVRARAVGQEFESFETLDGKTYRTVKIKAVDALGLTIAHQDGIRRIPPAELPLEMQDLYQFGEEEAAEKLEEEDKMAETVDRRGEQAQLDKDAKIKAASERRKAEDQAKRAAKIAELEAGILNAEAKIDAEMQRAQEYRAKDSAARARGNVSSHLATAKQAEEAAERYRQAIVAARKQIAELQRVID